MAFGRKPKSDDLAPEAAEPVTSTEGATSTDSEPEIIGGMAISIDGRTSIVGGTPRRTPTHDDEW